MDNQRISLLNWAYYSQEKTMEELRHSLLYTTLELEQTRVVVQEELRKRDDQIMSLKDLLSKTMKERDDAQEKCQRLVLDKLLVQQHQQQKQKQQQQQQVVAPMSGISTIEDEPRRGNESTNGFSSSDCEESIVSSPVIDPNQNPLTHLPSPPSLTQPEYFPQSHIELVTEKPLPEKGKLLQAVMKAGPLLQTLLLAGPLPQWRHPPPQLQSFEIPPVTISSPPPQLPHQLPHQIGINDCDIINNNCGKVNRKRVLYDGSDSPTETKYQRVVFH